MQLPPFFVPARPFIFLVIFLEALKRRITETLDTQKRYLEFHCNVKNRHLRECQQFGSCRHNKSTRQVARSNTLGVSNHLSVLLSLRILTSQHLQVLVMRYAQGKLLVREGCFLMRLRVCLYPADFTTDPLIVGDCSRGSFLGEHPAEREKSIGWELRGRVSWKEAHFRSRTGFFLF